MNFLIKLIATFFFTGFFPIAPATFASAVFALIYFVVPGGEVLANPWVCLATLIVSIPVSSRMEKHYGEDPGCVVIDEVVGMQVILIGVSGAGVWAVAGAFFLFRVFDILKPYPVNSSQALPGGWGIVVDDILAGVYTRLALMLLSLVIPAMKVFMP